MQKIVGGAADVQALLVPRDVPLSELTALMDGLAQNSPDQLWFMAGSTTVDCSKSFGIEDFDAAIGSMGGNGMYHAVARGAEAP
jgi:hypothetical protein